MIYHTTEIEYTLEAEIIEADVVGTMEDYMLEAIKNENDQICDESDSRCREEYKLMTKITLCMIPLKKMVEIKYTYGF